MSLNEKDNVYLAEAMQCANQAIGLSSPNPRVGCVLVKDGLIIGRGFTQAAGQPHAEVMAIRDARVRGYDVSACTAYVTLEPCCHFGRTPPCVNALIEAKVVQVVVILEDANPQVAGKGIAALRAAGVSVDVLPREHPLAQAAYELNIGFIQRMSRQRVYTRLKWAASADNKTALSNGCSQWITSAEARADGHIFRARADVIVTGIGTVLHDDPQLNVRGLTVAQPPAKCIIDSHAHTPVEAKLFEDGAPVWLACVEPEKVNSEFEAQARRLHDLREAHSQLVVLSLPATQQGKVDLIALWAYLYERNINEVHVEAGASINAALLIADLVDELLMYMAPRVIGAGLLTADFPTNTQLDNLSDKPSWIWRTPKLVGRDLRLVLQKKFAEQ